MSTIRENVPGESALCAGLEHMRSVSQQHEGIKFGEPLEISRPSYCAPRVAEVPEIYLADVCNGGRQSRTDDAGWLPSPHLAPKSALPQTRTCESTIRLRVLHGTTKPSITDRPCLSHLSST